jgi:hypothetical protein
MNGIFNLNSPTDLLRKLESDFARIENNPRDENAAADFFVTAEGLLDWLYPGKANKQARESERSSNTLLQVTSHLATSVKHFKAEAKHHGSVKNTKKTGGIFGANVFAARAFRANSFPKGNLLIELETKPAQELGSPITAIELARRVLNYWQTRLSAIP